MVTIIFSYLIRITLAEKVINYIDGRSTISLTEITTTLTRLKNIVNVICGFSSELIDYNLLWKSGSNLYPITDEELLGKGFRICDEYMELYII